MKSGWFLKKTGTGCNSFKNPLAHFRSLKTDWKGLSCTSQHILLYEALLVSNLVLLCNCSSASSLSIGTSNSSLKKTSWYERREILCQQQLIWSLPKTVYWGRLSSSLLITYYFYETFHLHQLLMAHFNHFFALHESNWDLFINCSSLNMTEKGLILSDTSLLAFSCLVYAWDACFVNNIISSHGLSFDLYHNERRHKNIPWYYAIISYFRVFTSLTHPKSATEVLKRTKLAPFLKYWIQKEINQKDLLGLTLPTRSAIIGYKVRVERFQLVSRYNKDNNFVDEIKKHLDVKQPSTHFRSALIA